MTNLFLKIHVNYSALKRLKTKLKFWGFEQKSKLFWSSAKIESRLFRWKKWYRDKILSRGWIFEISLSNALFKVRKGQNPDMDAYSGFFDNAAEDSTELLQILNDNGITDVYVCGLALDVCVKSTCLDGLRLGFRLAVIEDLCRGVDCDGIDEARKSILANGGLVTNAEAAVALARGLKRSLVMAQQAVCTLAKKWSGDEHADDFWTENNQQQSNCLPRSTVIEKTSQHRTNSVFAETLEPLKFNNFYRSFILH